MNPLSATPTPIYDALYAQWRAGRLAVPGERGPEDHCPVPDFGYRPAMDHWNHAPHPLQPGPGEWVPRQLPWPGGRSPAPVPVLHATTRPF